MAESGSSWFAVNPSPELRLAALCVGRGRSARSAAWKNTATSQNVRHEERREQGEVGGSGGVDVHQD